jgi:hypothetical protein
MSEKSNQLINVKFAGMADRAKLRLDEFAVKFANDPAHAFTWSSSAFQDAARLSVFSEIAESPICFYDVADARNVLAKKIVEKSRSPAQSTSPTSNLMKQYELAAWVEALDAFDYL